MKRLLFFFISNVNLFLMAQISYSESVIDMGIIESAYEIKADITIKNNGDKKAYLLKADTERETKVFASKKTLMPGDTALLVISFIPESEGTFNQKIQLFVSTKFEADIIQITGKLKELKTDNKMACFYFGKSNKTNENSKVAVIPGTKKEPEVVTNTPTIVPSKTITPASESTITIASNTISNTKKEKTTLLPEEQYKPNNLLFLVDVSNSMKDSLKLPLMIKSLHFLIDHLREVDKITFVVYANETKVLLNGVSGKEKALLHKTVDSLKAGGMTKGRQAIMTSEDILLKNYIEGGNNQLLLVTDGKFPFYESDEKLFIQKQINQPVKMSAIGFGKDKDALKNLKSIAKKGKGNFIHVKKSSQINEQIMDEIKSQSKIQ
ncbi:MAG: VWA domain-containing protein [Bacteroidia bacterium]